MSSSKLPPITEVPAAHLEGRALSHGWSVGKLIERPVGATGGVFSIPYEAVHTDGRAAFVKALNVSAALTSQGDLLENLQRFTDDHKFEADLLELCRDKNLSKVIRLIDQGELKVPEAGVLQRVPYLVFEMADGDLHAFEDAFSGIDFVWILRTMKQVAQGLEQLHLLPAVHQDLKPSNVLTQENGEAIKIGDLGRAELRGIPGPGSGRSIPGALAYAPPEQLYRNFAGTWEERRAGDAYLLGSLGVQLITNHCATALLVSKLEPQFHPTVWSGTFDEVVPYLVNAHSRVQDDTRAALRRMCSVPEVVAEVGSALAQLTHPIPMDRGHPRARPGTSSNFDLRRYVSLFNRLAFSMQIRLARSA